MEVLKIFKIVMSGLILQNINKTFSQGKQILQVLKNINLEINRGEIVTLIGPSGSGKTTLLQIAGLLDNPDSGNITINSHHLSTKDLNSNNEEMTIVRRNNIGFVYQYHNLLPEFSAIENIAMPLLIKGASKVEAFTKAEMILEDIDLVDRKNHRPGELSGGQQQRVAVGRAIASQPSILLADEPTGNLDSDNANNIFNLLIQFTKKYHIASLIVTHNIELAKKTDRIITIKDGMING